MRRALARLGVVLLVAAAPVGVYLSPSHGPSYPEQWDPRVAELAAFVERERGLEFEHPIHVEFLEDKDFVAKVTAPEPSAEEREEAQDFLEVLRALGLVTGHPDLFAAQNRLVGSDIVGVYRPTEQALYVRGTEVTPYVRATAAHELTHALQDQHFDLTAMQDDAPGGDDTAVTALIEGDASRIEGAYVATLSPEDQTAYATEEQARADAADGSREGIPQVLKDRLALPYVFGPTLLDSLVADGGNRAVDAAFRRPPYAEAQVLDPGAYPTGWKPVVLKDPALPAKAEEIDGTSPFGQVSLVEVLGTRIGYEKAWAGVQGWRGDAMRPYRLGGRTCVAATVALADDPSAQRFRDAIVAWGASSVDGPEDGRVQFDTCDPGAAARPAAVEPSAFHVLAVRTQVIRTLMQGGDVDFAKSRCMTDTLITGLGPERFAAFESEQPTPREQTRIKLLLNRAYTTC